MTPDYDLFTYPRAPGFKERTTSRDAARSMAGEAEALREQVFAAIRDAGAGGLTADEAATILERTVLSIRPRLSELAHSNPPRIVPNGARRPNESGRMAKAWRAA